MMEKKKIDQNYILRELHQKDLDQLINLFFRIFKKEWDLKFWKWFLYQNPHDTHTFSLWDKETLIGFNMALKEIISVNGTLHDSALLSTALVHKNYRRQGIYSFICKNLYNHLSHKGYLLAYGFPNELYDCKLYRKDKIGWDFCQKKNILIKTIKSFKHIQNNKNKDKKNQFYFQKIDKFPEKINLVFSLRKKGIYFVKYNDYLNWRYIEHPINHYDCFLIRDKDDIILGYFVLKTYINKFNQKFGEIDDFFFLFENKDIFNATYDFIFNYFIEIKNDFISTWVGENNKFFNFLIEKGFEKQQMKTSWGFIILNKIDSYINDQILNINEWDLRMGDSDVF